MYKTHKQEVQIDLSGDEGETLNALLYKINDLVHQLLYLKLGIEATNIPIPSKRDPEHKE